MDAPVEVSQQWYQSQGGLDARRRSPVGAAVARGHGRLRPAHRGDSLPWAQSLAARCPKGRPAIGHPQGAAAGRGDRL
ncbi:hypothetical protein B296_00020171 [Ensete ventricosum]|uniref:Uncharacterized protein n=1 Tax=Ensete ventricosum TaxID=4639 RepID=A0A426X5K5_ENSVE|nr:hypothetical protein B296_00020171 [Ensete ventricosum]